MYIDTDTLIVYQVVKIKCSKQTYKFITMASLVAVRKRPVLLIKQGGAADKSLDDDFEVKSRADEEEEVISDAMSAKISYSFRVSSRVCFLRFMNLTATSWPVKIS